MTLKGIALAACLALAGCSSLRSLVPDDQRLRMTVKKAEPRCAAQIIAEHFAPNVKSATEEKIVAEVTNRPSAATFSSATKRESIVIERLTITLNPTSGGDLDVVAGLEYITDVGMKSEHTREFPMSQPEQEELRQVADRIGQQCVKY